MRSMATALWHSVARMRGVACMARLMLCVYKKRWTINVPLEANLAVRPNPCLMPGQRTGLLLNWCHDHRGGGGCGE